MNLTEVMIARRDILAGTAAIVTASLPVTVSPLTPQTLMSLLALAEHYPQPPWCRPLLLLHRGAFFAGRLTAWTRLAWGRPLSHCAFAFGVLRPVDYPCWPNSRVPAPSTPATAPNKPASVIGATPCTSKRTATP